jgi:hypothetical protein
MAIRSGLAAQLGAKAETTPGTYSAPDHFYEFTSVAVGLQQDEIESAALRAGNRALRSDRRKNNRKGVGGQISKPLMNKQDGLLWKAMLGTVAITTPTGGTLTRRHTHTIGDLYGQSLTLQAGIPDVAGTVQPFSWLGCKFTEWEISQELDDFAMMNLTVDGWDEATSQGLAAASYSTGLELFAFDTCTIQVAGANFDTRSFRLTGNNGLDTERYSVRSSTLKKEQVPAALISITGELEGEFESLTAYNRFVNKTVVALSATWTSATVIEGSFVYKVTITIPAVRFDGQTPEVSGPDIVGQPLPFTVLYDGSAELITVTVDTTDTAS